MRPRTLKWAILTMVSLVRPPVSEAREAACGPYNDDKSGLAETCTFQHAGVNKAGQDRSGLVKVKGQWGAKGTVGRQLKKDQW